MGSPTRYDFNGPPKLRLLGAEFERIWGLSDTHPDLRRLFI